MKARVASVIGDRDAQRFGDLVERLPAYMTLSKQLLTDPAVPTRSKALLCLGGVYVISPIDLVLGIIPIAGQLDDAYLLLMGLKKSLETMPAPLAQQHLATSGISLQDIDDDIALVVSIAKRLARVVITTGAKIGRAGKTTYRFARNNIGRWKQTT